MPVCRECGEKSHELLWCDKGLCNKKWCPMHAPDKCPFCGNPKENFRVIRQ